MRPACGTAARNSTHSASDSNCSSPARTAPASRTATSSQAGVLGMIDGAWADRRTSPARDLRAAGKVPARQRAINRSSRVRIRPIRPHTATSSTVSIRSRAATTAIAACRLERREEKFAMIKTNIYCYFYQGFFPPDFPGPRPAKRGRRRSGVQGPNRSTPSRFRFSSSTVTPNTSSRSRAGAIATTP